MKAVLTSCLLFFLLVGVAYAAEAGFNAPPRPDGIPCQSVGPIAGAVEHAGGGGEIYSFDRPIRASVAISAPFDLSMYDADSATTVILWSGGISVTNVFSTGDEIWSGWVTVTSTVTSLFVQPPDKKPSSILCFNLLGQPTPQETPAEASPTSTKQSPFANATPIIVMTPVPTPTVAPSQTPLIIVVDGSHPVTSPGQSVPSKPGNGGWVPTNLDESKEQAKPASVLYLTVVTR